MIKTQIIGTGACGNKAALKLAKENVVAPDDILLVNSTMQDIENIDLGEIPAANIIHLGTKDNKGNITLASGAGKQAKVGEELAFNALDTGVLDLDSFIKPDTQQIIIVTSLAGGTGSGSSIAIAEEIRDNYSTPENPIAVRIIGFSGFENDLREIQNTLYFFKRIADDFVVDVICNKKFLTTGVSQLKACELANDEFVKKVSILAGNCITPSEFNIDQRDMTKVISRFGYSNVEYTQITEKIKNIEHFNQVLQSMIDNSTSMDTEKAGDLVMAVIVNLPKTQQEYIDHSFKVLKDAYGNAFELYEHVQEDELLTPFIAFIISGMELPIDQVLVMEAKYSEQRESSRSSRRRNVYDTLSSINTGDDEEEFDYGAQQGSRSRRSRRSQQQEQRPLKEKTTVNPNEGY